MRLSSKSMQLSLIIMMLCPIYGFAQTRPAAPAKSTGTPAKKAAAPARPAVKKKAPAKKAPAKKAPAKKAPAKTPAPTTKPDKWIITTLRVEGLRNYPEAQVLAVAGLKIGQLAGSQEFEAAYDRLSASGVFDTIGYKFEASPKKDGYIGVFQVTELEPLLPLRFERLGVSDEELKNFLAAKDPLFLPSKLAANQTIIDRYRGWIREFLESKRLDSDIKGVVTLSGDRLGVMFEPVKPPPSIAQVTFEGNKARKQDALRNSIVASIGAPYTEERFRQVLNASVLPLYEAQGRVKTRFPKIRTEPAADVKGVNVFVTVEESEQYRLGKVAFATQTPMSAADLLKTGRFKLGDICNFDQVNEGVERIRTVLRRSGYVQAKVVAERDIHDKEKTLDLALKVEAGPRYSMGRLNVVGLDLVGAAEIKRMWGLKEGQPFNSDYPQNFLDRVREQRIFDNVSGAKQEVRLDEKAGTADVTLTFAGLKGAEK